MVFYLVMQNTQQKNWHFEETYKGLIQTALIGLRIPILINGGALIAIFAFLGQYKSTPLQLGCVKTASFWFVGGLCLGSFGYVFAYLTQYKLYRETVEMAPGKGLFKHQNFLYATIFLESASILIFAYGSWLAVSSLSY